jgi:VanZ family protein
MAGWVVIIILSLVPASRRPHSGMSGSYEHFMAYAAVAFCLGIGLVPRWTWRKLLAAMVLTAACLELAQLAIPGRNAAVAGFLAGAFGAAAGLAVARLGRENHPAV